MKRVLLTIDKKWELPITLTILFLGALVIRYIVILQTPVIAHDSILYLKTAKLYYAGNYHDALLMCQFSIFPFFLACFYRIVGDVEKSLYELFNIVDYETFKPVIPNMSINSEHFIKFYSKHAQNPLHYP